MDKTSVSNFVKLLKEDYEDVGSVFVEEEHKFYDHIQGSVDIEYAASLFIGESILHYKAISYYTLVKLVLAALNAKGLNKTKEKTL